MARRSFLAAALAAAVLLAGCASTPGPGTTTTVDTSFEDGLTGWTENADVPEDPNRPGREVAWNVTASTERARTGERSVAFALDGRQDDGTVWITQPIRIEPNQPYHASVSMWAYAEEENVNTRAHLVAHLGFRAPSVEEDFPASGGNTSKAANATGAGLREPLEQAPGWTRYNFTWDVPATGAREVYASVGISAVWETRMVFHVDDLAIDLTRPVATGQGGGAAGSY